MFPFFYIDCDGHIWVPPCCDCNCAAEEEAAPDPVHAPLRAVELIEVVAEEVIEEVVEVVAEEPPAPQPVVYEYEAEPDESLVDRRVLAERAALLVEEKSRAREREKKPFHERDNRAFI